MSRLSARITAITPSATLAVDAKAKALQAAGEDVIGFGAGEPDFPTPPHIVEAAVQAARDPKLHKYTPAGGLPELRDAIAAKTKRDSGLDITANQVVVTNGGKHAVYNAMVALVDPGDEVILPAPYWTTYPEPVRLCGGVPVEVLAGADQGYRVTVDQLEAARTPRTKVLVFVSPSNPTGAVYRRDEIEAIGRWAVEHDIWVLTDEIYEHLTYDGVQHHSMPVVVPDLTDRCLVLNGVAKTYAMTGWRVGWLAGPFDAIAACTSLQSHQTSNVGNVAQAAALAALEGPLDAVAEMRAAFDRRRHNIVALLDKIDGVRCPMPEGAFYAFPSFDDLIGTTIAGVRIDSSLVLADVVLEHAKVAFVPGEAFGAPGYGRFSYAMGDDAITEGIHRIADFLGAR
jgi:aspartate/methionine/tyrosine aminotransferase